MRRPGRMGQAVAVLALMWTTVLLPVVAHAHSSELTASPRAGAALDAVPGEVVITFDTPIMDIGAALVVRDGTGSDATAGPPVIERRRIAVPLRDDSAPGDYSVAYRVVSADGHAITAQYAFTVAGPAAASARPSARAASPETPPATSDAAAAGTASSTPVIVVAVVAVVAAVAVGAAVALWKRRTSRPDGAIALDR